MRLLLLCLLFATQIFGQDKADKIPTKIQKSIPDLTKHLTKGKFTQKDKAAAIYDWIIHNIDYDYDRLSSEKYFVGVNAKDILRSKTAICNGYVELMKAMLDEVKIENETVTGYVHDVAWSPGDLTLEILHAWLALKVDDEWMLCDPTWDAGYIGRLPIDRKEYSPKKYLVPLKMYKNELKKARVVEKREETELERKEDYEDKPKFKDKIGFISDPSTDFFLINTDTFLLDHLPLDPIWQLRSDYINIEEFAYSRDSLKMRLAENGGNSQDYESAISVFKSRDFLHQYIEKGEKGFEYNPYNPGIKALNYYNFMALIHNKQLQKYARGSQYEINESKYPFLKAINDTIIKYTKLYRTFEKDLFKNRKVFDKDKYNKSKAFDKNNIKYLKKIQSENENLINYIKSNDEQIKKNGDRLDVMKEKIEEDFPHAFNYSKPSDFKDDIVKLWKDSVKMQLDAITSIRDTLSAKRSNTSFNELLYDVRYLNYLLTVNSDFIQFKSYSNNEIIDEVDSLIDHYSSHAVMLYEDSLRTELVQKDVMGIIKQSTGYLRASKANFRQLEKEGRIDDARYYEAFMQSKMVEIIKVAEEIFGRSESFNDQLVPVLRNNPEIRGLLRLMEDQQDNKEEKNEFIEEQVEDGHSRTESLIERMQEDSKRWKSKYR